MEDSRNLEWKNYCLAEKLLYNYKNPRIQTGQMEFTLEFSNGIKIQTKDKTISELKEEHFNGHNVKLIYKGALLQNQSLLSNYFTNQGPFKVLAIKTSDSAIEKQQSLLEKQEIATKNYNRALATRPKHNEVIMGFCKFVTPLPEFADSEKARELLQKIRDDIGIRTIMKQREWRVTTLKELHPKERTILGYNQNRGEVIALRLRTPLLDGFNSYNEIIKVMLHELAHMVFSEHDENFHRLDRELNEEYAKYAHKNTLGQGSYGFLNAESMQGDTRVLGGRNFEGDRRDIMLRAAELRLTKEEEAIKNGCFLNKK
jgi:hypothetical protein